MPAAAEPSVLKSRAGRALPRPLGMLAGCAMLQHWPSGFLYWAGLGVLVLSVPSNPRAWWRYVRTGMVPQPPVDPEYLQPGGYRVELTAVGKRRGDVVQAVRQVSELELTTVLAIIDDAAGVIADGVSEQSADRIAARVERAGGSVTVLGDAAVP